MKSKTSYSREGAQEGARNAARAGSSSRSEKTAQGRTTSPRAPSQSKRERAVLERREAIVAAGLAEFIAKGFANTRLEDVAKRAGVGKGTIYLHFTDKEALFQELVRTALAPVAARLGGFALNDGSVRSMMDHFVQMLARDVVNTTRGDLVRLIASEGARFPALAEFYYREVVAHGVAGMRRLIEAGIARGEITNKALLDFPQLVVAPVIGAIIWQGMFGKFAPLDAEGMMRLHIDLIFSERKAA